MNTIKKFKNHWQVLNSNGHTVANCRSEREAKHFIATCGQFPAASQGFGSEKVHQRIGHTVRRIDIYP